MLKLLLDTCRRLYDWEQLRDLLPDAGRCGALAGDRLLLVEIDTWNGLLEAMAKTFDVDALMDLWHEAPRSIRAKPDVIEHYASCLVSAHAAGEAERVLRDYLDDNWQASTIECYARLDVLATDSQIETAENWLRQHPANPWLQLALGKMCISRGMWVRARSYLEASLASKPMPETFLVLAQLLEDHMNVTARVCTCSRVISVKPHWPELKTISSVS